VKTRIRPEHASMLQADDWLAGLRDGGSTERAGPGKAEPTGPGPGGPGCAVPASYGYGVPASPGRAGSAGYVRAGPAAGGARPEAAAIWCEIGSCLSWHDDPAALGEADTRARAIDAGWRIDALGRLACPRCQQSAPRFWASRPVAVRDRDMASATTAPIPAVPGGGTARGAWLPKSRDPGRAARGYPPASWAELEWHHDSRPMRPVPPGR
jgi:hypothetical protein